MMIFLRPVITLLTSKAGLIAIAALLLLGALLMALDKAADKREAEVRGQYEEAATKSALEAAASERKANANSDVRQTEFEAQQAQIRKEIDDAKANGDNPINGYFDGLRKAQSGGGENQPSD